MDSYYGQNTSHECNYCSKILPTYGELVEHKKTHVGDRPFSCHICNKRFTQKAHLNIHKRTHTGEKPYACHICHKRFAQSSHLNSHKRIHAGDRPFFCVVCNTGFSQKHRFDAHLPCMQHSQTSRSVAAGSGAVSSTGRAYLNQEQMGLSASAATVAFSGGDGDADSMPEQKPDINFLNSLNQSLMQQLADLSSEQLGGSGTQGASQDDGGNSSQSTAGFGGAGVIKDEMRGSGNVSSAYIPAASTHRRKPAFIRRVDNEGADDSSAPQMAEGDNDASMNSLISTNNSFPDTDYDEESTDFDDDNAEASFDNGFRKAGLGEKRSNSGCRTSGPLPANPALLPMRITPNDKIMNGTSTAGEKTEPQLAAQVRTNHRISLVNFTAEELVTHLMSRADVHRCDFCRLIFQDAAMYHIHRNMHDKNDLRCCNFCGKLLQDRYDFAAHFLNEHR